MSGDLLKIATQATELATSLGADEVTTSISKSVSTEMSQREGVVEKSKQSHSMSISVSLLVDGRYSIHSASDPRPEALRSFLEKAIAATRFLEPDDNRGLSKITDMGSYDAQLLDLYDKGWTNRTPTNRREDLAILEGACIDQGKNDPVRSISVWVWDANTESCMLCSNGYSAQWKRSQFGHGGSITMEEGDRLPEAYDFYSARHLSDLPSLEEVAKSLLVRGRRRLSSNAIDSDRLPMLLENRAAPKVLNVLTGPMSGTSIYEKRSCLVGKRGNRIAPNGFSIYNDPLIRRGIASFPYDSDGLESKKLPLIEDGILRNFFVGVYNGRRLEEQPTTASSANLTMSAGTRSPQEILNDLPKAIRVEGFLGGNTNPITGDYSFGITGTLFKNGKAVQGVSEMNISGNLFDLLPKWQEAATDIWTFGHYRVPSLLFNDIQFSGI